MELHLTVTVPDKLASQVAALLEQQRYCLSPRPGDYGYVVPPESIVVTDITASVSVTAA